MGHVQDVGTIANWTPARLTRYLQNELNQRPQVAKTGVSSDSLYVHDTLTFSSGDLQTADTILTRPISGVIAINNNPIATQSWVGTGYAPINSPTFTGIPAAPTPATADNSTTLATTAFVKAQGYITTAGVSSVFGRTGAVVAASGDYSVSQVTGAAPLASPAFTGTPTAPTPATGDASTNIATTAFVGATLLYDSGDVSGVSSVSTSSFPQTYNDLLVVWMLQSASGSLDQLWIQINGSASTTYCSQTTYANSTTTTSAATNNIAHGIAGFVSPSTGFQGMGGQIIFPHYTANKKRTWFGQFSACGSGTSFYTGTASGMLNTTTAAITSLAFSMSSASTFSGRICVYGLG